MNAPSNIRPIRREAPAPVAPFTPAPARSVADVAIAAAERAAAALSGKAPAPEPLGAHGRWSPEFEAAMAAMRAAQSALFDAERAARKALNSQLTPAQRSYMGGALADMQSGVGLRFGAAQTWDQRQRAIANGNATTEWMMVTGSAAHVRATELFKSQGFA